MRMLCSVKLSPHRYKTPQGYLYCKDAIIARTGPQTYLKSEIIEGSDSNEYIDVDRKPEEVFSEKTMASFEGAPLTIDHPSVSVGPDNYKDLSVGRVQNIRRGEFEGQPVMLADIIVNDAEAIELIESGEMVELSCGYDCDITGGDNPEQINIRGNHVALCEQGRAGIARIQDSKKEKWGVKPIEDAVSKGTLIQEFGKQGKQYKIKKIIGNVIYAESLETGKNFLFKKDEENIEWAQITKSEVKDHFMGVLPKERRYKYRGWVIVDYGYSSAPYSIEDYPYTKGFKTLEEAKAFIRKELSDSKKVEDSFEQFNVFIDNMTLEEAKEYCRVYGVKGKKKPDGFVIFGARRNIENLLNDFIGEERHIHRILEEGWYSTPDFEEQMENALRLDAAPKYAVFVKKDSKWTVFGGNESGKVDERAFSKKYEDVKVVENKDLDKVKAELNKEIKDEEPIIQEEPMTEEQAKEWAREYLETEWYNNSWEKPHPWGSAEFASKKLGRKLNKEDAPIIPICKAMYKEVIGELLDKTRFHIKVDFANSFGSDGWYNYKDLESAHKAAVNYVRKCNRYGKSGRGEILIYSHEKDGSLLAASVAIDSKWSGKRYSNGYPIPVDSDEYDVRKRIDNTKYEEKLRPMLESIEPETPIKTGFNDAMSKHYVIVLSGESDESTWLDENDKPTDDFNKAKKFETYEEADSHRKTYCKGSVQEIRDSRIGENKLKEEEVEVVKKLLEGIEYEAPIEYDNKLKVIDIFFFKKPELRKAARKLVDLYNIELTEEDDTLSITLYNKLDKPRGIYLNEDSIKNKEKWTGFDLLRGPASKEFKAYLRDRGFYFEPSENGDYVHFEVKNADEYVIQRAEDIRKHWAQFKDSYSRKFYVKAIKALEDELEKLEKNEILDENNEDYEKQKNKMRKTIQKQIKEYKAKLEND